MTADQGFDFSHYQGVIDWHAVKAAGIKFAYGKVIEGTGSPDARWAANRAGALAVGIPVGGYFWAHPNLDPVASADGFTSRLNQFPGMLQPVLDIEHNGNPTSNPTSPGGRTPTQIHNWIHTFRARVQSRGYRLDTYTGGWFWNAYVLPGIPGGHCDECANSRLYLSRYASDMGAVPKPWTHAAVWQYTETGTVPGVPSSGEDRDVLVGTEQLSDLIYGAPAPTPTPAPPAKKELPDMLIARPTTPGTYLLVSGAGVTVLLDSESVSALVKVGVPEATLSDADFARVKALVK
jgi:GH25 family lysozyme M1 (1,4-beta-N-acetylmuramidase)